MGSPGPALGWVDSSHRSKESPGTKDGEPSRWPGAGWGVGAGGGLLAFGVQTLRAVGLELPCVKEPAGWASPGPMMCSLWQEQRELALQ